MLRGLSCYASDCEATSDLDHASLQPRRWNLKNLKSSLSLLAPAGLWKLKSQREYGKIEGGRHEREGENFLCIAGQTLRYPYGKFSTTSCFSLFLSPLSGVALHSKGQMLSDAIIEKFNLCSGQFIEMNPQTGSCFL